MFPQNQEKKNLQSSLSILCLVFFPAQNKAVRRRQAIHNDLGLIISNKIYASSKTEHQKQNKTKKRYEQKRLKTSSFESAKVPGWWRHKEPQVLNPSFPAGDEVIDPARKFYLSLDQMNRTKKPGRSWEEAGEESTAYLYVRNSFQDSPYFGSLCGLQIWSHIILVNPGQGSGPNWSGESRNQSHKNVAFQNPKWAVLLSPVPPTQKKKHNTHYPAPMKSFKRYKPVSNMMWKGLKRSHYHIRENWGS